MNISSRVSVVIPALNEEATIAAALLSVSDADEIVVVDGGSSDRTGEVARDHGARVMTTGAGRGAQQADGAAGTSGEWILFLHADTRLGPGACAFIRTCDELVKGGSFRLRFDSPRTIYRLMEAAVGLRTRALSLPYGDQGIFCRRDAYLKAGGMPRLPVMEDVAFVRALGRLGPLTFPPIDALTSVRRYERRGIVRSVASNLWLLTRYLAGADAEKLARAYRT